MNNIITILLLSAFFGFTVKMADLLNEHGLKLFKGSAFLFGMLWGLTGAFFILSNNILSSFFLAILLHWILRYRIDYINHGIAASIILITFFYNLPNFMMNWTVFLTIFVTYSFFGLLNDASDRGDIRGKLSKIFKLNTHLIIVPLMLALLNSSYWIIAGSSILQIVFYDLTAKIGMRVVKKQTLIH